MAIHDKEFYELLAQFDKYAKQNLRGRLDKEDKQLWSKRVIYQDGKINEAFLVFSAGYMFRKSIENGE